jgi:anti-sigma regulatory factor (Ser/Thr protein kinase)
VPANARAVTLSVNVPHEGNGVSLARHAFAGELALVGVTDDVRQDVMLVISELVSNAVKHASPLPGDKVAVACAINEDCLHIEITDGGSLTRPSPEVATIFALGGRGLDIVRMISREWGVSQDGDSVTVWADVPRVRKQLADTGIDVISH